MIRRLALGFLAIASLAMLVLAVLPGARGGVAFTVLAMAFPPAMILAAVGGRRPPRLLLAVLALLLTVLESTGVGLLILRGSIADAPWIGGLPAAAAVLVYGLGLLPLALVGFGYALVFDHFELRDDDLTRLRRRADRRRQDEP